MSRHEPSRRSRHTGSRQQVLAIVFTVLMIGSVVTPALALVPAASATTTAASNVTVTGQFTESDATPAANDTIVFDGFDNTSDHVTVSTDSTGQYAADLENGGLYEVEYYQDNKSSNADVAYPKDGSPDVAAVTNITARSGTSFNHTFAQGHNLTVTVRNASGVPIQGANVDVTPHTDIPNTNDAVHAHVSASTNASGELVHPDSDGPGFEVTGTVHVDVDPPNGAYVGESKTIDVTADTHLNLTLRPAVNVSGTLTEADGDAAANDTLEWDGRGRLRGLHHRRNVTAPDGSFATPLAQNGTYEVEYHQDDPRNDSDLAYPKDGSADIYSFGTVTYGADTSGVTRQVPAGHNLTVTVVDESGTPIPNAQIHVSHEQPVAGSDHDARAHVSAATNGSGELVHPNSDGPGFEVTGTVDIHVEPPAGSSYATNGTEINVTGDRHLRFVLHDTVTVRGQLYEFGGDPAAKDLIHMHSRDFRHGTDNVTSDNGRYTVDVIDNATYDGKYYQRNPYNASAVAFPKDGSVDVYAAGRFSFGSDSSLNISLPKGNNLTVSVEDSAGNPVPDATVHVSHHRDIPGTEDDAHAHVRGQTNAMGHLEHPESDGLGFEVNGTVHVSVEPPAGSLLSENGTSLDVQSDTHIVLVLNPQVNVTGTVEYANGTAAANDEVHLERTDFETQTENRTSAAGKYRLQVGQNEQYFHQFFQMNASVTDRPAFPRDGVADLYAIQIVDIGTADRNLGTTTIPNASVLNVTVVDGNGTPVQNAEVNIQHRNGDARAFAESHTNANGVMTAGGQPGVEVTGEIDLHIEPPEGSELSSDFTRVQVDNDTHVRVVLQQTVNVSGQVFEPDGDGAANDELQWDGREGTDHFEDVVTDGVGRFLDVRLIKNGTYEVEYYQENPQVDNDLEYPKDGVVDVDIIRVLSPSGDQIITPTLDVGHNLTVKVVAPDGTPVSGATVDVTPHQDVPGTSNNAHAHVQAKTNATGMLVHPDSDGPGFEVNGTVHVNVESPTGAYVGESRTVDVAGDTHLNLTLRPAVNVSGWVANHSGDPVAESVIVFDGVSREGTDDWTNNITTATGNFSASLIENGEYRVKFRQDNPRTQTDVAYPTDDVPDVFLIDQTSYSSDTALRELRLPQAHQLNVTVFNASGAPIEGGRVEVIHEAHNTGTGIHDFTTDSQGRMIHPQSDGPGVDVVGEIRLRIHPPAGSGLLTNQTQLENVSADRHLNVTLTEGVSIKGKLTQFDGAPSTDNRIKFHTVNQGPPDIVQSTQTNASGNFDVLVGPNRSYNVQYRQTPATRDGYVDVYAFPRVDVGGGAFDFGERTLPKGHLLNVTVVDVNGTPVSDARVVVNHRNEDAWSTAGLVTDQSGAMIDPDTSLTGIEVNGTVSVRVEPPDGNGLATNRTTVDVHSDRALTIVLKPLVDVRGQFREADGDPAASDTLAMFPDGSLGGQTVITQTNATGNYSFSVAMDSTHDIQYYQYDFDDGTGPLFVRDDSPDMVAVTRLNTSGVTGTIDRGRHQFQTAYTLNVSVVDENGTPIENASVNVEHHNPPADAGLLGIPTNANGLMQFDPSRANEPDGPPPGIELFGNVSIEARPPSNSDRFLDTSTVVDRRYSKNLNISQDTRVEITLIEPRNVSGTLNEADGTPTEADFISAWRTGGIDPGDHLLAVNRTSSSGQFKVGVPPNVSYDLQALQYNQTANHLGERDGTVDLYAMDRRNESTDTDLGNVSLPAGHVVNVIVVDESGAPVANASVDVTHVNDSNGASAHFVNHPTNAQGKMVAKAFPFFDINRSDVPGLELRGNVTIEVSPPENSSHSSGFVQRTYRRNLTVTSNQTVTFTLNETDPINITAVNLHRNTVTVDEPVNVSVTVQNTGSVNETANLSLLVNGTVVQNKTVEIPGQSNATIYFNHTFSEAGTFEVAVNEATAGIVTVENVTTVDDGQPGFGVGLAVMAVLLVALILRRRD